MNIREARSTDLPAILALYQELHPEDPVLDKTRAQRTLHQILQADGLHLFVLEEAGSPLATCYLNIVPNLTRGASPYGIIENVVTTQARRGSGIGKAILCHALAFAWSAGCYKVMLMTGSKKPSTLAFYRACGFTDADKTGFVARPGSTT